MIASGLVVLTIVALATLWPQNIPSANKVSYAYVANAGSGSVSVVDLTKFEVVDTIKVGTQGSHGIAITPDERYIYVGDSVFNNPNASGVAVIDSSTRKVVARIPVGGGVHGVDISRSGKYVYASSPAMNGTYVIDTLTNTILYEIGIPVTSGHMDLSLDDRYLYLTNIRTRQLYVIDTLKNQLVTAAPVGDTPNEPVLTPDGKYLFVANFGSSDITVINTADYKVVKTLQAGEGTHGIAVTPDGRYVWTANRKSNDIAVIDVAALRVVRFIPTGNWTNHVAFTQDGRYALATSGGGAAEVGTLWIIDASDYKVIKALQVGKDPHEISLEDLKPFSTMPATPKDGSGNIQYTKKDKGEGSVTTEVTLLSPQYLQGQGKTEEVAQHDFDQYIIFHVSLDTHSIDLTAYDLRKAAILRDDTGNQLPAVEWKAESNDAHHRSGWLLFPKPDGQGIVVLSPKTTYIELVLRDIGGIRERVFRWNLPMPGLQKSPASGKLCLHPNSPLQWLRRNFAGETMQS